MPVSPSRRRKVVSAALLGLVIIFFGCGRRSDDVERITENGVEVVVNRLAPYEISGEPTDLRLDEEFSIDTEDDETVRRGVADIRAFDVDSGGNIYVFQERENDRNLVYKFDTNGHFVAPYGTRGPGPGEVQSPIFMNLTAQDEIPIQDYSGRPKLLIFNPDGGAVKEIHPDVGQAGLLTPVMSPLSNGNYLRFQDFPDLVGDKHRYDILDLVGPKFEKIRELGRCDYGLLSRFAQKVKGTPRIFIVELRGERIYLGDEGRGYEISVFDLDGKLIRKIKKEYNPAPASEEFKDIVRQNFELSKDKLVIPDLMPPFHYFFLDDDRRLYVKTYERGRKPQEYWHDVFDSEGVFIARASLPGHGSWMYPGRDLNRAKARANRFYCLREKESGFVELVVYQMTWK